MPPHFSYTLIADGSSDRALLPIVDWVLRAATDRPFESYFVSSADARTHDLPLKVSRGIALFPSDLVFVHRDAETRAGYEDRIVEIRESVNDPSVRLVPIVPVRMTEAWLLIDESAIRMAANNPNGTCPLALPRANSLEALVDPKESLFQLLRDASELGARRIRSFNVGRARARVGELTQSYAVLRCLASFSEFEQRTREAVVAMEGHT